MKTKNFLVIFLISVFFLPVISSADLKPAYSFADGNGRAWAIEEGRDKKPDIGIDEEGQAWVICDGSIYRADPEGLVEVSHSENGIPSQFASSSDGKLYILWKESNNYVVITELSNGKIERIASLDIKHKNYPNFFLYVDSAERLWITGNFPTIYLWSDNKWTSYEIKPEQFVLRDHDRKTKWSEVDFSPIYVKELSKDRLIFYSKGRRHSAYLDGFITFSVSKFEHLRGIPDLPRGRIASLALISGGFFWTAVHQGRYYDNSISDWRDKIGIFEVDLKARKASAIVPANHPLAGLPILKIMTDKNKKGDRWALSFNKKKRSSSLWRVNKSGVKLAIEDIEIFDEHRITHYRYPFLADKKGNIWLGATHAGVWAKLKVSDIWQHVDWRSGFPLHSIMKIKEDRHGNIWFCDNYEDINNGLCCLTPNAKKLEDWLRDISFSNWRTVPLITDEHGRITDKMEFDQSGNLWTVSGKDILCRFDADKGEWVKFPLKKDSEADVLAHDNSGRVWMFSWSSNSDWQVAVFEDEKIAYFPSRQSACEFIAKKRENCIVYSDSRGRCEFEYKLFIIGGKACFISRRWGGLLNYFDGRNWKLWKIEEIDPTTREKRWDNPPFFDKDGMLRVNIEKKNWRWDGEKWKAASYLEGPIKRKERLKSLKYNKQKELKNKLNQLEKLSKDKIKNVFETDDGMVWVQTNFSIYKKADDLLLEIDKGKHPLMGNKIESTLSDKNENFYVKTPAGWFVRLADKGTSPETLIEMKLVLIEKLPVSFSFSGKDDKTTQEKLRFSWSLDEGKWSSPSYDKTISFDYLSNGEHVLKVKALDEELSYDLTPAVIRFTVKISSEKLLADNLEMLKSSDYNGRETAVKNLVRIGKDSLPELKKMRASTQDKDFCWWIDVVIQQIEPER